MSETVTIAVNWKRGSNNGAAISNYLLQYSANYGATWTTVSTDSISKTATVSNLPAGLPYLFRVAAVNLVGPGQYSTPTFAVKTPKTNFSGNANDSAEFTADASFTPQAVAGWPSGTYARIPDMTSNTAPSGIASGASNAGYNYLFDASNAWRVFANKPEVRFYVYSPAYRWLTLINKDAENNFSAHVQYEFAAPSLISGYRLQSIWGPDSYACPKSWTFSGSNDGTNFDVLDSRVLTGSEAFRTVPGSFFTAVIETPVAYKIYRWTFTKNFDENTSLTGIAAAQVLPPDNAITYQWQAKVGGIWRDLSRQTYATINLTPAIYAGLTNEQSASSATLRCAVNCKNYAQVLTAETTWLVISLDSSNFYPYFSSSNYWPDGNSTENGVNYSVMNMAAAESVYFNLDNWSYSSDDLSWFTGNNWTLKLQTSADGLNWTDDYTTNQRTASPSAYRQTTPPVGTSYWRWFVQFNWPLTLTNGAQCATKTAPSVVLGHAKIVVAA